MYRIMVVDDEVVVSYQLGKRLSKMGYDVVGSASSGRESVQMARCLKPDIILMDIVMPGDLDGIEAASIIRKELDTPVIFITAHSTDQFIERAKVVRPSGYILKPFNDNEVRASIEVALYNQKEERSLLGVIDKFRSTVESLDDAVLTVGSERKIVNWNSSARNFFCCDNSDEFGNVIGNLVTESRRPWFDAEVELALSGMEKTEEKNSWKQGVRWKLRDGGESDAEFMIIGHKSREGTFATIIIRTADSIAKNIKLPGIFQNADNDWADKLGNFLSVCRYCKMVRDKDGRYYHLDDYLHEKVGVSYSHGICPDCLKEIFPETEME